MVIIPDLSGVVILKFLKVLAEKLQIQWEWAEHRLLLLTLFRKFVKMGGVKGVVAAWGAGCVNILRGPLWRILIDETCVRRLGIPIPLRAEMIGLEVFLWVLGNCYCWLWA